MPKKKLKRSASIRLASRCDNHPERRAVYSFIDAWRKRTFGQLRNLCQACFDEEREQDRLLMAKRERIKRARARRSM